MSDSARTGVAFLIGTAVGGAVALLLAPDKGSRTRTRLKTKAKTTYGKAEEALSDAKGTVGEKVSHVAEVAEKNKEAIKEAAEEAKAAYKREMAESK